MRAAGYAVRPVVLEREFNARYWGHPVTLQAVRRWLIGEAIPSQDKLQVLAEWLKIEPEILRYGSAIQQAIKDHHRRWETGINFAEREAIDAFLQLPPVQRKLVRDVIHTFATVHSPKPLELEASTPASVTVSRS